MAKKASRLETLERASKVRALLTGYINCIEAPETREYITNGIFLRLKEMFGDDEKAIAACVTKQLSVLSTNNLITMYREGTTNYYSGKKVAEQEVPRKYTKKEKAAAVSSMPHLDFQWDETTRTVHVTTPDFSFTFGVKK